jgi:hypothetical protein
MFVKNENEQFEKCTYPVGKKQVKYTHYTLVLVGSKKKTGETDMQIFNTN